MNCFLWYNWSGIYYAIINYHIWLFKIFCLYSVKCSIVILILSMYIVRDRHVLYESTRACFVLIFSDRFLLQHSSCEIYLIVFTYVFNYNPRLHIRLVEEENEIAIARFMFKNMWLNVTLNFGIFYYYIILIQGEITIVQICCIYSVYSVIIKWNVLNSTYRFLRCNVKSF